MPLAKFSIPPDEPASEVEWLVRCLVTHGASSVMLDLDGKHVKGIRYRYRANSPERLVDFSEQPARPMLLVARGRS